MRKTGTRRDFRRRKDELRRSGGAISPQHWPTALIVCPTSLVRNVGRTRRYQCADLQVGEGVRDRESLLPAGANRQWGYFEHETWTSENADRVRKAFAKGYLDVGKSYAEATALNQFLHRMTRPVRMSTCSKRCPSRESIRV